MVGRSARPGFMSGTRAPRRIPAHKGRGLPIILTVATRLRLPQRRAVEVRDCVTKVGVAGLGRARIESVKKPKLTSRVTGLVWDDKELELAHVGSVIELHTTAGGCGWPLIQAGEHGRDEHKADLIHRIDVSTVNQPLPSFGGLDWRAIRVNPVPGSVITRWEFEPYVLVAVVAVRCSQRVDQLVGIGIPEIHPQVRVLTDQVTGGDGIGEERKDRLIVGSLSDGT